MLDKLGEDQRQGHENQREIIAPDRGRGRRLRMFQAGLWGYCISQVHISSQGDRRMRDRMLSHGKLWIAPNPPAWQFKDETSFHLRLTR
jgi:hypothetical protein